MSLFNFLYKTLAKRTNDPSNKMWLPGQLENISGGNPNGKLLPLHEKNWSLGAIKGQAGKTITTDMAGNWAWVLQGTGHGNLLVDHKAIPCPENPFATLTFPQVTIEGLQNIQANNLPQSTTGPEGYQSIVTLTFNQYNGENGLPELPRLYLSGHYEMQQCLCLASFQDLTKCAGVMSTTIKGTGEFTMDISQACLDAYIAITVQGEGDNQSVKLTLTKVHLRGSTPDTQPVLSLNKLNIDTKIAMLKPYWERAATNAITSPEGAKGIVHNLNSSLNQPGNLDKLTQLLTEKMNGLVDKVMSPKPDDIPMPGATTGLTNPVDSYLLNRARIAVQNPAASWYLPRILGSFSHPSIEPLDLQLLSLPDKTIEGLPYTNNQLTDTQFVGLSNAKAEPQNIVWANPDLNATAQLAGITQPPTLSGGPVIPNPPISGKGTLSVTPLGMGAISGDYTVSINGGTLNLNVTPTGDDVADLNIAVAALSLSIPDDNMALSLNISEVFREMINHYVNSPKTKKMIQDKLNAILSKKQTDLGVKLTHTIKQSITSKLDN